MKKSEVIYQGKVKPRRSLVTEKQTKASKITSQYQHIDIF